jgi:hypothetical protein
LAIGDPAEEEGGHTPSVELACEGSVLPMSGRGKSAGALALDGME